MHDRLAAIHNDPLTIDLTLNPGLFKPSVAHGVAHAGSQGFGLAVGRTRGDDHTLKKRRQMLGVKHLNILGFHIFQAVHNGALEFLDVFFYNGGSGHQVVK